MKARIGLLALGVALFCAPAAAQAAVVPVTSLTGPFAATNSTVTMSPGQGVHFGTYADGGQIGGTMLYQGLNGRPLSAITSFGYTYTFRERGNTTGAAPYMRIFLDEDPAVDADGDGNPANDVEHDIVLDPGECGANVPPQSTDVLSNTANTTVRFDDDACGTNPQEDYATILADPARNGLTIVNVLISQGNSTGQDVSAIVRSMALNADLFDFTAQPEPGQGGATGAPSVTRIVQVPVNVPAQPATGVTRAATCKGDDLITLHATKRTRQVSLRATLRGRRLKVKGRAITVDLRSRTEGNYDVKIVQRFRSKGRVRTSTTHRVRSVACA